MTKRTQTVPNAEEPQIVYKLQCKNNPALFSKGGTQISWDDDNSILPFVDQVMEIE